MTAAEREQQPEADSQPMGITLKGDWQEWTYGPYKKYRPLHERLQEFWLMKKYDPTAKTALYLIRLMMLKRIGQYEHDNETIEKSTNELLGRLQGGIKGAMSTMLSALWAGFSVAEKIPAASGTEWWWERLDLLHPMSFFPTYVTSPTEKMGIALDAKTKTVTEVTQYPDHIGGSPVTHPIERVVYWPLMAQEREEVYGESLLEGARRAWFSKVKEEAFWNTFTEKMAMPTPVITVPPGNVKNANGEEVTYTKLLADFYQELEPGMLLAIPVDPQTPFEFALISPTGDGAAFDLICRYWDAQEFKAILTPPLLIQDPEHSTRAQAETNLEMFLFLLEGLRDDLDAPWMDQVVQPLVIYNHGEQDDYGKWHWEDLQQDDLEMLAKIFRDIEDTKSRAHQVGREIPEADDEKIRETFSAVLATPAEVKATAPPHPPAPSPSQTPAREEGGNAPIQ